MLSPQLGFIEFCNYWSMFIKNRADSHRFRVVWPVTIIIEFDNINRFDVTKRMFEGRGRGNVVMLSCVKMGRDQILE